MKAPRLVISSLAVMAALTCTALMSACTTSSDASSVRQSGARRVVDSASAKSASTPELTADTATVNLPLDLAAQLYVEHDAIVVARSQGTVDSLLVEIGDRVAAGQLMAKLESADQEIALASADAVLENQGRVVARARVLAKPGGITAADSEQAELQLRQAEIARRKARRDLDLTRIVAPFDGVVSARFVRPRRFVAVGDTLFRVSETAPLFARVRVPEANIETVRLGEPATVVGLHGERVGASVVHVAPALDAASGTREVVVRVARADDRLLAGAAVHVLLGHEPRHVVSVPRDAIAPDNYVLVVENGRTTLRPVIIGAQLANDRVEIVSGLSAGERIARPPR